MTERRPNRGRLTASWITSISSQRGSLRGKIRLQPRHAYTTNLSALGLPYSVAVTGLMTLATNHYKIGVGNSFAFIDNATWVKGGHTIFGIEPTLS